MIAVIKVAGQQYKVEKDQTLYIPHVEGNAGDKVSLEALLASANGKLSAGPAVTAEIVDQVKGDTVIAYKHGFFAIVVSGVKGIAIILPQIEAISRLISYYR